ncbi:MAG: CDF family Co(II)/Ni(II) efflux transporter DmeF [Rubrivivax sp.]|nr:CDF family Co(II)/Ni(II) efflux transporter DmeF [Rubrivivax sp.]
MQTHDLSPWQHEHVFDRGNRAGERGTRLVVWITAVTMLVEILAGWLTNSMALLADGFHMSSHAVAIGLSAFAYAAARRHAADPRYAFGTWKVEVLGGFASALFLLVVVALMVVGSVERLLSPQHIQYAEAMAVAALGLVVNLVCAFILGDARQGHHAHGHGHGHDHGGHHHDHHDHHDDDDGHGHVPATPRKDLNLHAAYVHVITDAATSVLALVALAGGWWYGWSWLDPLMGIVGGLLVALWARRLIADTSKVLLDREMDDPVVGHIRQAVAGRGKASRSELTDLHVWRVGQQRYACALSLLTHDSSLRPDAVRGWLVELDAVAHATIEINLCTQAHADPL